MEEDDKQKLNKTLKEELYWSYANLAMADSAVTKGQDSYDKTNYIIRARLFKSLMNGTMNIRSFYYDEKEKIGTGQRCNYCGSGDNLSLDHIFPIKYGGRDNPENLVLACRTCNSSKGKKDLMEWMHENNEFLPILIIRRYLKLVYEYSKENNLLEKQIDSLIKEDLPFKIDHLPKNFPNLVS